MRTISFTVTGQTITGSAISDLVGNTKNYVEASFTFSSIWDDMLKVAIFTCNSKQYPALIDSNGKCLVPNIALTSDYMDVGVYAGATDGTRLTTDTCRVRIEESVRQKPSYDLITFYEDFKEHVESSAVSNDGIHNFRINPSTFKAQYYDAINETWKDVDGLVDVDDEFSDSSENPVQNKIIKAKNDSQDTAIASNTTHRESSVTNSAGVHNFRVNTTTNRGQIYDSTSEEWNDIEAACAVDSSFDSSSENPVQNKVIKAKLDTMDESIALNDAHRATTIPSQNGSHGFRVNPTTHKPQYYDSTNQEWVNTAGAVDIDSSFSDSSENPVQNKVVKAKNDSQDTAIEANTTHRGTTIPSSAGSHGLRVDTTSEKVQYYDATNEEWKDTKAVVTIDSALSSSSENPVQNKVIKSAIDSHTGGSVNDSAGVHQFRVNSSTHRPQYYDETMQVWENCTDSGGGGGTITVDDQLSATSTNPVENKVIKAKLDTMDTAIGANTTHAGTKIPSAAGSHGVRVDATTEKAQYYDPLAEQWKGIKPNITIDSAISSSSENPVQNKKIYDALTPLNSHIALSILSAAGAHGIRFYQSKLQGYNSSTSEWDDISIGGGDEERLDAIEQNILALALALTIYQQAEISGTSENIVIEVFDDTSGYIIVKGAYDSTNHRLYA